MAGSGVGVGVGVGWGWALMEAERLLTFSAFRMGAHSRCSNKYGSRLMVFKPMISHVTFYLYTNGAAPPYDT